MKKYFTILVLVLLVVLVYFSLPKFVNYEGYYCSINKEKDCTEIMSTYSDKLEGFSLAKARVSLNSALSVDSQVKTFEVDLIFPDKLYIILEKKLPVFAVGSANNIHKALIDENGYVLNLVDNTQLPTVIIDVLPNPGSRLSVNEMFSVRLFSSISKVSSLSNAGLIKNKLVIEDQNGVGYVFPVEGDIELLTGTYNLIVSRLNNLSRETTIKNNDFSEIDFRYKNPILK